VLIRKRNGGIDAPCLSFIRFCSIACGAKFGGLRWIPDSEMFPDLRLLIPATVATFFVTAAAGLYASMRITQEQIVARAEARAAFEDNPITRIAAAWPLPEPSRAAALREIAKIATYAPPAPGNPDAGNINAAPVVAYGPSPDPNESRTPESTGSTGSDRPDLDGNSAGRAAIDKEKRDAAKKAQQAAKKKAVKVVQRRRAIEPAQERPADQSNGGYPLYLTVPVTN
jgi:hypothetical protein